MPALRELHPAAEANVLRTVELLRDEAAVLDAAVDAVLAEAGEPPALAVLRALPPALARLVLGAAGAAAARPSGHRADEILALGEHGALDVGGGLRARIERGRVEFVADSARESAPPRLRRSVLRDESIGEILVQADELQHRVRQLGEEITRDYAGKDLLLIGVLKGAVFFLADLMRHIEVPCEVDFMAVASYGSSDRIRPAWCGS